MRYKLTFSRRASPNKCEFVRRTLWADSLGGAIETAMQLDPALLYPVNVTREPSFTVRGRRKDVILGWPQP